MRKIIVGSEIPEDYSINNYILYGYLKGDYSEMLNEIFLFDKNNSINQDDLLNYNHLTFKYSILNSNKVVDYLNSLMNTDFPPSFWEVIINPWWIYMIQYFHFQKTMILKFLNIYKNETLGFELLGKNLLNFKFEDTNDFIKNGLSSPDFNYWVISRIIEKLAPNNLYLTYRTNKLINTPYRTNFNFKRCIVSFYYKIHDKFFPNVIGLYNLRFDNKIILFNIFRKLNYTKKAVKKELLLAEMEMIHFFDDVFNEIWKSSIPSSFFKSKINNLEINGSVLFDSSEISNDYLKIRIANLRRLGIPIFSLQHGGHNYGTGRFASFMIFDYFLADVFIKWGNYNNTQIINNSIFLPYQKLSRRHFFSNKILKDKIIWIGSHNLSFFFRYDSNLQMSHVDDYRRMKINFFTKILNNSKLKSNFVFRPYFYFKDGINDSEFFKNEFPDLIIYDQKFEFDVYCHAKLLIMDHPGTTLNYAFARNIPTICIWKNSFYKFTDEALEIFLEMKRNNLLFNDEKFLYEFLDSNVDIYSWWFSNNVQSIVSKFNFLYSSQDSNWIKEWSRSLR
jgi:putative transferase (TIGR04331 family)